MKHLAAQKIKCVSSVSYNPYITCITLTALCLWRWTKCPFQRPANRESADFADYADEEESRRRQDRDGAEGGNRAEQNLQLLDLA
jgi:hypothetical protein